MKQEIVPQGAYLLLHSFMNMSRNITGRTAWKCGKTICRGNLWGGKFPAYFQPTKEAGAQGIQTAKGAGYSIEDGKRAESEGRCTDRRAGGV